MQNLLLVAIGGALGATSRYGVGLLAARMLGVAFPWGTFVVNLIGCFVMGIVGQWIVGAETAAAVNETPGPAATWARHLIAIGFLGGLTTFSAFGWDTFRELSAGRLTTAVANVAANVLLCLLAVWLGATLLKSLQ